MNDWTKNLKQRRIVAKQTEHLHVPNFNLLSCYIHTYHARLTYSVLSSTKFHLDRCIMTPLLGQKPRSWPNLKCLRLTHSSHSPISRKHGLREWTFVVLFRIKFELDRYIANLTNFEIFESPILNNNLSSVAHVDKTSILHIHSGKYNKNSSGDEIANVNFFYNIAHVEASAYAHWTSS